MFRRGKVYGVPRDRIDALRASPFFEGLSDKVLARIGGHLDSIEVPRGQVLTVEGAMPREAFIIDLGVADVYVRGDVVRQATSGELIGELSLIQHAPRSATVVARTPMRLLALDSKGLRRLFDDEQVAERVAHNVARHLNNRDV